MIYYGRSVETAMEEFSILDKVLSSKQVADIQNFSPSDTLAQLCKELSGKEEETLRRRFGLRGQDKETLEEIGKRFAVTRERIRQIEDAAITKVRKSRRFSELIHPVEELVREILDTHGGAMTEQSLLRELFRESEPTESDRRAVSFLLDELLAEKFDHIGKAQNLRPGWKLKTLPLSALHEMLRELAQVFVAAGHAMTIEALQARLRTAPYFQTHPDKQRDEALSASLDLSLQLARNPFQEYGLTSWGTVAPKRMNDKIYLVLKKAGKPLHFTEITRIVNETEFDRRRAYAPTVHNELILNDQYVLIGRGVYVLREWGYKPGVVADVLVGILREASTPLSREELVERTLQQRMVKKNTIHLALADKTKFTRLPDGRYELASRSEQNPQP